LKLEFYSRGNFCFCKKPWIFLLMCCYACGGPFPNKNPGVVLQKIPVTQEQVYDLSGYAGGGASTPYALFDENAYVDPRYEKAGEGFIPVTNCQPTVHPAIYFHAAEGSRIVADLKIPYNIREIYLYDRSRTSDSCWIYTGTLKKWKPVAAWVTASQSAGRWKKISLDEQSRYVMIRFSSYETNITEMVFYGFPMDSVPAAGHFTIHKGFTHTPLDQFLGVNYIMENEARWLKPFHYSRLYNFALDYDNDTSRDEHRVRFNMLHYGRYSKENGNYIFDIDTLQHVNNGNIWFSIRGVSGWMSGLGLTDKDRPLNRPFLNTEDPASYSRHAEMMWHLAAFFGYNPVDTNLLSLSHEPRRSGRGSMSVYENGNEEDATWVGNKYCSPYEYFSQSTADWDGDEGRLGNRHGIHAADPGASLMISGLTGLDTNRVKVYAFLSENLREDKKFIWQGGIQYHYYAQKNGKGISPEADSMRSKLALVADCSNRIAPGVKCFLGENGYDKSPVSRQCTPVIPGMSAAQSQGIMLLRAINATFFSGFDAYILYWLRDGNPENDPRVYLTSGILRTLPDGKTQVYPGWYYISTLVNFLGKYRPERVIREEGGIWIYQYRHTVYPDSLAYFIYKPTVNGSHVSSFTLRTGKTISNQVRKVSFLDNTDQGKEEIIPVNNGEIKMDVLEKPTLILYKEPGVGK
jgi:hypothetical protein